MAVFVLGKNKKPLMPCTEKRARLLLTRQRAIVVRFYPFTIRLKDRSKGEVQALRLGIDPGSKTTGLSVVRECKEIKATSNVSIKRFVLWLAELMHRGASIRDALMRRKHLRRSRRSRNLPYRAPRFLNRGNKLKGWLAPSLQHRIDTILAWVKRLLQLAPITHISQELVRFDTQAMQHPDIQGLEYQQGTLFGFEIKEYLLEKWGRLCVYCGCQDKPLQIDHIYPKAKGGSDRISNLTLACQSCNTKKASQPIALFLRNQPKVLARILKQSQQPLHDTAAVNSTRYALLTALKKFHLPLEIASGGRTKWNRYRLSIPKSHALDAACIGQVDHVNDWRCPLLQIKACGRGAYQRTRLTAQGFPRSFLLRVKKVYGFQTGDMVKAHVTKGKKTGIYQGRVAIRASGSFNIQTKDSVIQGISYRYCQLWQQADGYGYSLVAPFIRGWEERERASRAALSLPGINAGVSRAS